MLSVVVQPSVKNFPIRHFQEHENQRAEHRQRHGAEQDDERIAEAVELRGEHEKDQDDGEHEDAAEICCPRVRNWRDSPV